MKPFLRPGIGYDGRILFRRSTRMPAASPTRWPAYFAGGLFLSALIALALYYGPTLTRSLADDPPANSKQKESTPAPSLEGGTAWLNTAGPLKIADLKGKIVLLDFWTLCCINCIHTLPDLAKLEKKYANELVIIGVHAAKFESEKNTQNIRKAILRYEIAHPVVNDADHVIWDRYGVQRLADPCLDRPGRESGRQYVGRRRTTRSSTK